ncbi:LEAF RUST 10 DISEASE-RESISTANCE LOCUS RECEPTOR-LIKE PROTEIN KINASE-like 2.5 isoform X5 [Prosopis cineraria]|uniref:LEAF RUST 10 DISEASE-RESISTANCE LOCUS RECEPTOR-LIKE PROTEIN KINASE-like 2.5 isoform X5 n=1 Tax=Prosopis cineraria TaxID=364024 RepID=UPI00240F6C12|nr:LEAF RUST 10 DISEASE-RESISTANCE LOCUS RECEPTOR-LIKE PROTEIN KINASE-like 2.5 isoform X5 [Prosopis cineraria]
MSLIYHNAIVCFTVFWLWLVAEGALVQQQPLVLKYHNGELLKGRITVNLVWYGSFTPIQRSIIVDFIESLNSPKAPLPSAATWWGTTGKYKGGSSALVVGKQYLHETYSLGKFLRSRHLQALASKFHDLDSITVVLTAKDVSVDGFCVSRCGTHRAIPPVGVAGSTKKRGRQLAIAISAGVGGLALILILIIYICKKHFRIENGKIFKKSRAYHDNNLRSFINNYSSLAPRKYSYSEVKRMTRSFSNKLGEGGYGVVYKASLPDGRLVAVKVVRESKGNGEEFINEVARISRTSHVNIVTLLGFCCERNKRVLIYEYMSNGSLDNFIYKRGSPNAFCILEWNVLYQVAIGIARGLEYLHRGCNTRILHLDIKPQNILLDETFCPKISDFGLAKICKESIVSILGTRGTVGFIAPEIFNRAFGGVSHKADVYSYGMLVLEMVGGRKNYDSRGSHTEEMYFPDWIYKDLERGHHPASSIVITMEDDEVVRKMTLVSLWCIQTNPLDRPAMSKVVEMLEGPLQSLSIPPKPSLESPTKSPVGLSNGSSEEIIQTNSLRS